MGLGVKLGVNALAGSSAFNEYSVGFDGVDEYCEGGSEFNSPLVKPWFGTLTFI